MEKKTSEHWQGDCVSGSSLWGRQWPVPNNALLKCNRARDSGWQMLNDEADVLKRQNGRPAVCLRPWLPLPPIWLLLHYTAMRQREAAGSHFDHILAGVEDEKGLLSKISDWTIGDRRRKHVSRTLSHSRCLSVVSWAVTHPVHHYLILTRYFHHVD